MANLITRYLFKLPAQPRRVLRICLYGLAAGGVAVAFQVVIHFLFNSGITRLASESTATFLIGSFIILITTGLIVGFLLNKVCWDARGSGVPQLKLAFWKDFGFVPWRVVWVKFIAGALSVGGGASLGREGPSVQLAGGVASNLAQALGEPKQNRREATAAGAAAGLAAAFNTPIAAVTFVMEEIIQDLNSRFLGGVLLSSILGAFVVYATLGKHPAFSIQEITETSWTVYLLIPLVAVLSALVGVAFQRSTLGLRKRRKEFERIPVWLRPALGGLITWLIGSAVFLKTGHLGVFGLGYTDLTQALNHNLPWKIAGLLLLAKLVATVACYGLGGCGGIFAPCLFFGGMCGVAIGGAVDLLIPQLALTGADQGMLAIVGMSACLGAVVRAPMTSILIVFEMTHQFSMVPALMLGALVSQAVGMALNRRNFYDALLTQDGHNIEHVIPPRDLQTWQQLPVSAIANFQAVTCKDLSAPGLRRLLKESPHQCFPVEQQEEVIGVLKREEAQAALSENRPPVLDDPVWVLPRNSIRELQMLLIESASHVVLLREGENGGMIGLVTLHDLLRAEVSLAKGPG